jgi:choice-of-anchor A domain-containing protein/prepilin-type N-terminal cleavage/methylation domain-containing protein
MLIMKTKHNSFSKCTGFIFAAGFSLIEVLMVIAVVSTVAAGALLGISSVSESAEATRLDRDVRVVNGAIRAYLLNGGTFLETDLVDPARVLAKLKSRASADSARQLAGVRGSMVDQRLTFELQSEEEAVSNGERARFIADRLNPRFVIERGGSRGIRRFVLDSEMAKQDFGAEERTVTMKLAKKDAWVWDYQASSPSRVRPASIPVATHVAAITSTNSGDALPLNPPVFSVKGGTYPLLSFDLPVSFTNPNPANTSSIVYSIDGGAFVHYDGQPVLVGPGASVAAYAVSTDPDDWEDSAATSREFAANIVPLALSLAVPNPSVTYAGVGGAMILGNTAAPSLAEPPVLTVTNLHQIPVSYQNSDSFALRWTYDGSSPLASATAVTGSAFAGGFEKEIVPIGLAKWQAGTTITISAVARSLNPNAMSDSPVVSGVVTVSPMSLRAPEITAATSGDSVTIAPKTEFGDTPAGFRILYTLDGTEPEEGNGMTYTGPINVPNELFVHTDLKARVFGPSGYTGWFVPSPSATLRKPSKASTSAGYEFLKQYHEAGLCGYTWNVLGRSSSVSGAQSLITGSIAVGPLAELDFDKLTYLGNIALDPLGVVTGPANVARTDISPIKTAATALSITAGLLTPTQTFGDIIGSKKIVATASDGMNIIKINSVKLASSEVLMFHGGPSDFFIVNVTDALELTGSSIIKLSGEIRPDRVLINSPNGASVKLTGGAGIMSISFLAPNSSVTIGGTTTYTGNIFSGNGSRLHGNPQLVGGNPFGECEDCCD